MRVATSAGRIVALQKARAGWSKPSGELFCFIPSLFKEDQLKKMDKLKKRKVGELS